MPVEQKGFFFNHWEKLLSLVVLFGIIGAGLYVKARTAESEQRQNPVRKIEDAIAFIRRTKPTPPLPPQVKEYAGEARKRYEDLAESQTVRPWVFWWPRPRIYEDVNVGTNQPTILIRFAEPIEKGSIVMKANDPELAKAVSFQHPLGIDYRIVVLTTADQEGWLTLSGRSGRRQHIMPISVRRDLGQRVLPPVEFEVKPERGYMVLTFKPNPKNKDSLVEVQSYEVYRRVASDLFADFEIYGGLAAASWEAKRKTVETKPDAGREPFAEREIGGPTRPGTGAPSKTKGLSTTRPALHTGPDRRRLDIGVPPERPGHMPPGVARAVEEKGKIYTLYDGDVVPDETYIYKVRARATRSYPAHSEFTPVTAATAPAAVAFRFTGGVSETVKVEVVRHFPRGLRKDRFTIVVGDEIGGVDRNGRKFLTGCYLVDYHRTASMMMLVKERRGDKMITRRKPVIGRIIYMDRRGNLRVRWRNESPSDLWKALEAKKTPDITEVGPRPEGRPPERFDVLRPERTGRRR